MENLIANHTDTLLNLKTGDNNPPIIFIHPIGGTVFSYKSLSHYLTTNHAIYGIQDELLNDEFFQHSSLEKQAAHYLQLVFDHLDINNIILGGLSSGGTLAFEMARQCLNHGIAVKQLLLFDTWATAPFDNQFRRYFDNIILRQAEKLKQTNTVKNEALKSRWLDRLWERMSLVLNYQPQAIAAPAALFKVTEFVAEYTVKDEIHYNWNNLVSSFKSIPVNGNHETMLDANNIPQLAEKLNAVLL